MSPLIKLVVFIGIVALVVIIFIKVLPYVLIILAAIGIWKIYQALNRPPDRRPPPVDWRRF